ncbi:MULTISPECIES: hypothetical protein [Legionella]|uniref:Periplasmic ligand-binding sensor domain protein n=1 Tax=Legionella maceachernii TaxID=466 RepID=A0A0W0VY12_9GAMM|nr:hypothetical protein [Legionella maceachernii]KTD25188.1 hypothetical protein Lmac_2166 [Legionella maceachernii]SJZ75914.1 hypothetical protein SAMN02745128_00958 [Legionella maceachernii]SUP03155.1 Uncharacterised protein [Legionella maceachernii]
MKTKTDSNTTTTQPISPNTSMPVSGPTASYQLSPSLWKILNFTVVTGTTCGTVVLFQSPIRTILTHLTMQGTLPQYSMSSIGILSALRELYKGTFSSLTGSAARTAYVTTTRNNRPTEVKENTASEENIPGIQFNKAGYVMSAAVGDYVITQIPKSLSQLKKTPNLLPPEFKWWSRNNLRQLFLGGAPAEIVAGITNYGALCVLEDELAKRLPFEDGKVRHLVAGAASGMCAGIISYPFAVFKDYTLVNATVTNGQLKIDSTATMFKKIATTVMQNPQEAISSFLANSAKQVFIRSLLTGGVFSTVAVMGTALGTEPLSSIIPKRFQPSGTNSQGFFCNRKTISNEPPSPQEHQETQPPPTAK